MSNPFTLRSALARRAGLVGAAAFAVQSAAGCYARQPVEAGAIAPGTTVVATVSDRGRVSLNGSLGESPATVEGRLTARTDSTLTVAVTGVESMRGVASRWAGESVTLRLADISYVQTKRLDRGRTALVAVGAAAAVAVLVAGLSLVIGNKNGGGDDPTPGGPGPGQETSKSPVNP
jgi:hypothetical protein